MWVPGRSKATNACVATRCTFFRNMYFKVLTLTFISCTTNFSIYRVYMMKKILFLFLYYNLFSFLYEKRKKMNKKFDKISF